MLAVEWEGVLEKIVRPFFEGNSLEGIKPSLVTFL
jgi:hypothetical protein